MSPKTPFLLQCPELACRSSLEGEARRELARIGRLDIGVVGCSVRVDVPRLCDGRGLPEGVHIELQVAGGCILTAAGAIRHDDRPADVASEIRRGFAQLERRLWRLRTARAEHTMAAPFAATIAREGAESPHSPDPLVGTTGRGVLRAPCAPETHHRARRSLAA